MKLVIQRIKEASMVCDERSVAVSAGLCVLFCAVNGDSDSDAVLLAKKTAGLRIFTDENDKMNLSVNDIGGEVLAVPNFTLAADSKKGNRPSFIESERPDRANYLFELYKNELIKNGIRRVESGVFGADMLVTIANNGPVTIIMDTNEWKK